MKYQSVLIVTYGRSGSTLLQGVLNTIDGVTLRGENQDFCWGLYTAWKSLATAKARWSDKAQSATDSWYGADQLDPDHFLVTARQIVRDQLAPGDGAKCFGFKEIRYLDHLQELFPYLQFLLTIFPRPAIIFNTREHSAVVNSAFWKKEDPQALTKKLRLADDLFFEFTSRHANAFIVRYENLVKGEQAIEPLFDFLGAKPDDERIRQTLETPHSFVPKPDTLNQGRQARNNRPTAQAASSEEGSALDVLTLDPMSGLVSVDTRVLVIAIVRDEIARLPWFIEYYRRLGCESFLFIDNGSIDGTVDFLRQQQDVMLYHTEAAHFRGSNSGRDWVNSLARQYALGKWVLCVDADELLCWPGSEQEHLSGLVKRAERLGLNRIFTPMIDAYGDTPTNQMAPYQQGQPFGDICPWVDPVENTQIFWDRGRLVLYGGPRNKHTDPGTKPPITTKQTLYFVEEDGYAHLGPHFDTYGIPSPLVAPLLHYKFMPDFRDRCEKNIREGNHWNNAQDYRNYKRHGLDSICFKTEHSVRITTGNDLQRHVQAISRLIRKQGLAGSIHVTSRFGKK